MKGWSVVDDSEYSRIAGSATGNAERAVGQTVTDSVLGQQPTQHGDEDATVFDVIGGAPFGQGSGRALDTLAVLTVYRGRRQQAAFASGRSQGRHPPLSRRAWD